MRYFIKLYCLFLGKICFQLIPQSLLMLGDLPKGAWEIPLNDSHPLCREEGKGREGAFENLCITSNHSKRKRCT